MPMWVEAMGQGKLKDWQGPGVGRVDRKEGWAGRVRWQWGGRDEEGEEGGNGEGEIGSWQWGEGGGGGGGGEEGTRGGEISQMIMMECLGGHKL